MKTELSKKRKELDHQESIIKDGLKSFQYVGEALRAIRDDELYVEEFDSFENYCKSRWNFPRQRAYQLIENSETAYALSKIFDTTKAKTAVLPEVESHAAALTHCADDNETRAKVWKAVVEEADGKPITAKAIAKKADEILPPKNEPAKTRSTKPAKPKESPKPAAEAKPNENPVEPKNQFDAEELEAKSKSMVVDTKLPIDARIAAQVKMLESFCRMVSKCFDDNLPTDPWLDEGQVEIARSQLKSCLSAIRVMKAYEKPCPKCSGKGCKTCRDAGYLPKMSFEMIGGK